MPLKLDLSLWSANLTALGAEVQALTGDADSLHFDVADGHFAPSLLFFPDLVEQLRPLTGLPFHVHLMVERPALWVDRFLEAGADRITVHAECPDAPEAIARVRDAGKSPGLALLLESPVSIAGAFRDTVESVLLLGTPVGVKGCGLAPEAGERLMEARRLFGAGIELIADGGIRRNTLPLLRAAGAETVVPGSLYFNAADRAACAAWLRSL
jgi:ribulose-phosphate 3-epimerase